MAKYGRFDPRNKKQDRHKQQSIYKDVRIRMDEEKGRRKNWDPASWIEKQDEDEEYENDRV